MELGLELHEGLLTFANRGPGSVARFREFGLKLDGLGVFDEDFLRVDEPDVRRGGVDGCGSKEEGEEGLHGRIQV